MDFRVDTGFFRHIKAIKLSRAHGSEAVLAVLRLYAYATEFRPNGVFMGADLLDLAEAIGTTEVVVAAMLDVGYLDPIAGGYELHNWAKRNGYAASADYRSAKATWAALKRHGLTAEAAAKEMERKGYSAFLEHLLKPATSSVEQKIKPASSSAEQKTFYAPTPTPTPTPTPEEEEYKTKTKSPQHAQSSEQPPCTRAHEGELMDENEGRISSDGNALGTHMADWHGNAENRDGTGGRRSVSTFEALYQQDPELDALTARVMELYPRSAAKLPPRAITLSLLRTAVKQEEREEFIRGLQQWLTDDEWRNRYAPKLKKFLDEEQWRSPPVLHESSTSGPVTKRGKDLKTMIERFADAATETDSLYNKVPIPRG